MLIQEHQDKTQGQTQSTRSGELNRLETFSSMLFVRLSVQDFEKADNYQGGEERGAEVATRMDGGDGSRRQQEQEVPPVKFELSWPPVEPPSPYQEEGEEERVRRRRERNKIAATR